MSTAPSAVPVWTVDAVHSSVEFSLAYMGFSVYRSGFRAVEGTLRGDPARPAGTSVEVSIPVESLDVTNERLRGRLMDPDLLGGRDHPAVTFRSTRVEARDAHHWSVTGDLTIHGVTRPVVLDTRYLGQGVHPFSKKTVAAFRAEAAIDRRDFGVSWNAAVEGGGPYLGDRVDISLVLMAARGE